MAYIANTAFEVKVSNHEFDSVANITGVFQNGSDTDEICSAGFLCVKDVLTANEGSRKGRTRGRRYHQQRKYLDHEGSSILYDGADPHLRLQHL